MPIFLPFIIGSALLGEFSELEKANQEKEMLKERMLQEKLATAQRMNQQMTQFQKVAGEQETQGAASGFTARTFAPLQQSTFNEFAEDERAEKLNLGMRENALQQNMDDIQRSKFWGFAGNLFDVGEGFANRDFQEKGPAKENKFDTRQKSDQTPGEFSFGDTFDLIDNIKNL